MAIAPEPAPVSESPQGTGQVFVPTPSQFFVLLAGYFALQVVLRVTFSTSTDLDESEAVMLSQKFSLGYGSDPPLYVWIQMVFFKALGTSVFALSVFKNLLLLSTYLLTFATARLVTRNPAAAVAAALSVFYLPSISWESQRDLTHSVLSATLSVATLYCFLKLHQTRRLKWYLAFGLAAGFGCISKYNYALWLVGLLVSGFLLREFRPAVLNRHLLLAAAVALAIFLPNAFWMLDHRDLALLNSSKFEFVQSVPWLQTTWLGFKSILQSLIAFASPLALVYMLVFLIAPKRTGRSAIETPRYRRLLVVSWTVIGLVLLLLVISVHATGFRERWFQPILVSLPIAAMLLVQNRLEGWRLKCLAFLSLAVMLAVAMAMPGRLLLAERLKREEPLTRPYAQLAKDLRPLIPSDSLLVCDTKLLAGNLRLGLADTTPLSRELLQLFPKRYSHCFLIWDARKDASLPEDLRIWAATHHGSQISGGEPRYLSATYRYHSSKQFRLGYLQLY
jgi:lipopolysaccharide core galacturonosyltransferase RgtB